MDSFFGLFTSRQGLVLTRAGSSSLGDNAVSAIRLQSVSGQPEIDSSAAWAARTTPEYHCAAVGYATHSQLGFLNAEAAAQLVADKGMDALRGTDGCYVACQVNRATNQILLISDPLGTRPVFYQRNGDRLAFASQAKWLASACDMVRSLNSKEALQFLMNRYSVGYSTVFRDAQRLPPGHEIRFDSNSGRLDVDQYWDLHFETSIRSLPTAASELHETLLQSHAAIFEELNSGSDSYRLFLTGGMDSRGILGYAEKLGHLPALAQTWGATDAKHGSDPAIARQLAKLAGIPFEFLEVTAEGWVENAAQWAWAGELLSDNANSYTTPLNFFAGSDDFNFRFAIAGDQMLGAGPLPATPNQAVYNILQGAQRMAAGPLWSLLKQQSHAEMRSDFDKGVQSLVERCPNSHPKDLQDYLYFHTYISRWILEPGNFKYPIMSVRRPLMTMEVVEKSRHLAPELRVDKAAYIHLLQREFPHFMKIPSMATESGIDWLFQSRNSSRLRSELIRLTRPEKLESLVIGSALEMDAVRSFLADFFDEVPRVSSAGGRFQRNLYDMRRRVSRVPLLRGISTRLQPLVRRVAGIEQAEDRRCRHEIVMRLALWSLFEEQARSPGDARVDV